MKSLLKCTKKNATVKLREFLSKGMVYAKSKGRKTYLKNIFSICYDNFVPL